MFTIIIRSFCVIIVGFNNFSHSVEVEEMYSDCNDDYTCLMYPEDCAVTQDCKIAAIIKKTGNTYNFRLLGIGPYYIAAGISKDRAMGEDAVAFCTEDIVGTALNPKSRNRTIFSNWKPDIANVDMKMQKGRIVCSFDVPSRFTADKLNINLAKPMYLLLATGPRQYPPYPGIPFAGHSIKLSSTHALLFGVGSAHDKGRIGDGSSRNGKEIGDGDQAPSSRYFLSNILLFSMQVAFYLLCK